MTKRLDSDLVICDFEATCWERHGCAIPEHRPLKQMEIIEFAAVVCDSKTLEIKRMFTRFVRPILNPKLSDFCIGLTSITQNDVDGADTFDKVVGEFVETVHPLQYSQWGSWGDYDYKQLASDCALWKTDSPFFDRPHINLKKLWAREISVGGKVGHKPCGGRKALGYMGLKFEGTPHRGIDDCINIARIIKPIFIG